jgi:hypothetical protein
MEDKMKQIEELTGRIISQAVHIEDYLEFFISNYLVKPQNQKTFFLQNYIIIDLSLEKKIAIFNEICKREKFDENKREKVINEIK